MIYYAIVIGLVIFVFSVVIFFMQRTSSKIAKQNKELATQNDQLLKQSKFDQQFVSNLSAELRTPLYGIIGLTNLLSEEHPELKEDQNIKSLKFSGDYLLTLINNILQVSKMDDNDVKARSIRFNIKEVVQNLVSSFRYATENTNNTIELNFDDAISNQLKGDPLILSQILMNLINNALRFTRNGEVKINAMLVDSDEASNKITFSVKHNGKEISKEEEKSIYYEFTKNRRSQGNYLGTGINTAIVNRLSESINGVLNLNKKDGEFTESLLTISFDIGKESDADLGKKIKALIVDDNKINLMVTSKLLVDENFDCVTVDNGLEAIELVREGDFNIVLMDVNMPNLNGVGATKKIREFNKDIPIIAFTAVDVTQLNEQMIRAGLNDYILKPFEKGQLLDKIYHHVNAFEAREYS
ncbi:ATP-binding response regulator [Spongiivirga citrea]|uniref:histidine kinase n=1 Tax=Spongiivirga citrea TaxID=1481457 RepID=A0A6M0CFQ9_9FLAO|nr:response regulator [Spongiivirga citrea]NER16716.1 response regulator [Spongiivirga citrea]